MMRTRQIVSQPKGIYFDQLKFFAAHLENCLKEGFSEKNTQKRQSFMGRKHLVFYQLLHVVIVFEILRENQACF